MKRVSAVYFLTLGLSQNRSNLSFLKTSKAPREAWEPTQPLVQWQQGLFRGDQVSVA